MQEENFSATQSLRLIESMIGRARNRFSEDGVLYLLWGWVILFCSVGHFILMYFRLLENPEMIWSLTWLALIFQTIYLIKKKKRKRVVTYTEEINRYVWLAFLLMMIAVGFILGKNNQWDKMYPAFLVLYGMPTFLSGVILRFTPLKLGGGACWVLSIIATFITMQYQLLLLGLAVVVAWIVPGYLLRVKYKKSNA